MTAAVRGDSDLAGRVAVISGATGNLGRVTARTLRDAGARLALLGTSAKRLRALEDELDGPSDRLMTHEVDLAAPDGAPRAAAATVDRFGRVDIVIQVIGGWTGGRPVIEVTDDDVADMLRRHFWSTFYLARTFVPQLTANGWGRLIAVSTPVASDPPARQLPYVVGKAAQEALFLTLAQELRASGVTANLIVVRKIEDAPADDADAGKPAAGTAPAEIAAAIRFLCSDNARAVNGARIPLYRSR